MRRRVRRGHTCYDKNPSANTMYVDIQSIAECHGGIDFNRLQYEPSGGTESIFPIIRYPHHCNTECVPAGGELPCSHIGEVSRDFFPINSLSGQPSKSHRKCNRWPGSLVACRSPALPVSIPVEVPSWQLRYLPTETQVGGNSTVALEASARRPGCLTSPCVGDVVVHVWLRRYRIDECRPGHASADHV